MLKFDGQQPPALPDVLNLAGICPNCGKGTTFTINTSPTGHLLKNRGVNRVVLNYHCDFCLEPIPVRYDIHSFDKNNNPTVHNAHLILRSVEEFNFEHVPEEVKGEIEEALNCLSVGAFNGFAAVCRRAVQEISTNLGAEASSKVQKQINEMAEIADLDEEMKDLAKQVMLTGHDGSHPHLPDVDNARAQVLLTLLSDLTYELYTRPGKVKEAAKLRLKAIEEEKEEEGE